MNRYEANRLAKEIFMSHGWQADAAWFEEYLEEYHDLNEDDSALVYDYYKRCCDRVSDWLRL